MPKPAGSTWNGDHQAAQRLALAKKAAVKNEGVYRELNKMSEPTGEVTTVQNEIERHFKLAAIFYDFEKLMPDTKLFTAASMASFHTDAASRLNRAARQDADSHVASMKMP